MQILIRLLLREQSVQRLYTASATIQFAFLAHQELIYSVCSDCRIMTDLNHVRFSISWAGNFQLSACIWLLLQDEQNS